MKTFRVIVEVQAENCRDAVEVARCSLENGNEPIAVLTDCPIAFPDPDMEGAMVIL